MLITADWVLPVARPPIRNGAVHVKGGKITAVGHVEDMAADLPGETRHDFPGCALVPGLVNAHTHLSLTALAGVVPPMPFAEWLRRLVPAMRSLDHDDHAASAAAGALECLRCGVTCVGDVVYGPESSAAAGDAGLGGMFFWEVLGVTRSALADTLAQQEFPTGDSCRVGRVRCGLSPHAPYTSGPDLLRALSEIARDGGYPFALHLAESAAELELMATGSGDLEPVARRSAHGFHPPRSSSVSYADRLGILGGAVAVHCATLTKGDPERLARSARGVVLCPRSNAYLGNGPAPVTALAATGVALGIGTDSSASVPDLDLLAEARALRQLAPTLSPERLLRMLTAEGAGILGLGDMFGALVPGCQADLAVFATGETDDPERALIDTGGASSIRAVCTAGIWRLLDGKTVVPPDALGVKVAAIQDKARASLEGLGLGAAPQKPERKRRRRG